MEPFKEYANKGRKLWTRKNLFIFERYLFTLVKSVSLDKSFQAILRLKAVSSKSKTKFSPPKKSLRRWCEYFTAITLFLSDFVIVFVTLECKLTNIFESGLIHLVQWIPTFHLSVDILLVNKYFSLLQTKPVFQVTFMTSNLSFLTEQNKTNTLIWIGNSVSLGEIRRATIYYL